ncbi:MAG: Flp pilus assembly protein RcpC/CpaB, partial [Candidatus Binatota bacterium]|nr:Flp pilus assembly protein RcpC/CpaB [Candidatus Binatota bacterium]
TTEGVAQLVTTPLLENVYVLFTGFYGAQVTARGYNTITVLVGPDEAKLLVWSTGLGELSILLRNPKDVELTDRAFLKGRPADLQALGRYEMKVKDVIDKARPQ